MNTLLENQFEFSNDVSLLLCYLQDNEIYYTFGEVDRTKDQQRLYYYGRKVTVNPHYQFDKKLEPLILTKGKILTKVLESQHEKRLAIDLNIFIRNKQGQYIWLNNPKQIGFRSTFEKIANYWKELNPKYNTCGYFWGWDFNHFERKSLNLIT